MSQSRLVETVLQGAACVVDRENRVIRGVKLLGESSVNSIEVDGKRYSGYAYPRSTREAAVSHYEGKFVYFNHRRDRSPRDLNDKAGWFEGVHEKGDGIYGDYHWLVDARNEKIADAAERNPRAFGFSHDAGGNPRVVNGRVEIQSIEFVESVDVVDSGATVKSLFESIGGNTVKMTIRSILESCFPKRKSRLKEMEDAMPMDAPVEMETEASTDDQIKAAFRGAVVAAFDDESMDTAATLAKMKEILKAYEKLTSSESSDPPSEPPAETTESRKNDDSTSKLAKTIESLNAKLESLERASEARRVLESLGINPAIIDDEHLKLLHSQADANAMKSLVESWPSHVTRPRRTGSTPLYESGGNATSYPKDRAGFVSSLRN